MSGQQKVSRDGQPELIRGPLHGSVQMQNMYRIGTTPLPGGEQGMDWIGFFNSQTSGPPICGRHDGNAITVECWPADEPSLVARIDAAIDYANEKLGL